jgi:hypothetical protein
LKIGKVLLFVIFVLSVFALVSCGKLEISFSDNDQMFEQIINATEQIKELDADFIEAIVSAVHEAMPEVNNMAEILTNIEATRFADLVMTEPVAEIQTSTDTDSLDDNEDKTESAIETTDSSETQTLALPEIRQFSLNTHEQTLYIKYLESLDVSVLAGETPITIGKIFIRLALDEELIACYGLHANSENLISKEEYIEEGKKLLSMMDSATRLRFANREFGDIDNKEFIQTTETMGYITHRDQFGFTHTFNFVKNNGDVWLIDFSPF